jgi:hypothetical protein
LEPDTREYVPLSQMVQLEEPGLLCAYPRGHAVHDAELVASVKNPMAHGVHPAEPGALLNLPAAQD